MRLTGKTLQIRGGATELSRSLIGLFNSPIHCEKPNLVQSSERLSDPTEITKADLAHRLDKIHHIPDNMIQVFGGPTV